MAFSLTAFHEKAYYPHGQKIHVGSLMGGQCDEWVVLDFEHAWCARYGKVVMNWPTNSKSTNVHWEWECG